MMARNKGTVKCMFPEYSSGDSSSDEEEDVEKQRRRIRTALKRRPIKVPFSMSEVEKEKSTSTARKVGSTLDDGGEDGLFVIDSTGGSGNLGVKNKDLDLSKETHTQLDPGVDLMKGLYINLDVFNRFQYEEPQEEKQNVEDARASELVAEVMKKATFKPSMEKNPVLPQVSKAELKRRRKEEREKTKGRDWFDMPATELTEERKRDLEVMQLRDALDPKRRYRTEDRTVLPKYFQVGTVIEHPADFYHSRVPRKERKQTIVEELLADADFQKRSKRKYAEIQQEKTYRGDKKKKRKLES